jgi:hypothetical protein
MRSSFVMLACVAACASKGSKGDPGAPGAPATSAIAAISPRVGVIGRELDVVIAGSNTTFDAATTASFGAGITVTSVTAASEAELVVHVKIDSAAAFGARDVRVVAGAATLVASGGFEIHPAIDVTVREGNAQQGGLVVVALHDNDATPFDTGTFGQGAPLFAIGGNAIAVDGIELGPLDATALVLVDPLAPARSQLVADNLDPLDGVTPTATFASDPSQLAIAATAVTQMTASVSDPITGPLQTRVYQITTAGPAIVLLNASGTGMTPITWTYPASGSNADLLSMARTDMQLPAPTATSFYWVAANSAFDVFAPPTTSAPTFDGALRIFPAQASSEAAAPHSTVGTAQTLAPADLASPLIVTGSVGATNEVDVYALGTFSLTCTRLALTTTGDLEAFVADASLAPALLVAPALPEHNASIITIAASPPGTYYLVVRARAGAKLPTGAYTVSLFNSGC